MAGATLSAPSSGLNRPAPTDAWGHAESDMTEATQQQQQQQPANGNCFYLTSLMGKGKLQASQVGSESQARQGTGTQGLEGARVLGSSQAQETSIASGLTTGQPLLPW